VFTVGSDGVGVNEELRDDQLRVYPNPTSNNFIIETPTNVKSAEVDLVGIDGRVIQSLSWTSLSPARKIEFDASSIPTGTYILRVSSENRTFSTTVSVVK
jgi:predicted fused transcriptional regulator/phosphomethylpyrimidine kinase